MHPMTTAVIVETGFLTNKANRKIIAEQPIIPAQALADVILLYLENQGLIENDG